MAETASGVWTPFEVTYDIGERFTRMLREVSRDLCVTYNDHKKRHCIEQCIEHHPDEKGNHWHLCRRIHVWLVQSEDGDAMPLNDRVIEKIKSMDMYAKYGIDGSKESLEKFKRQSADRERERDEKIARATKEIAHLNRVDNKRHWRRLIDMIRRHDVYRPHK
jgi:hypothetical protein